MTKLKVLCLHGYGTNASFLEKQFEPLRKVLEPYCQFYFVDGPYEAPENFIIDQKVLQLINGPTLSWFPNVSFKYKQEKFYSQIQLLRQAFQKHGQSFDGILGFSQGAVVTHFLFRAMQQKKIGWKCLKNLRFCILCSGNFWNFPDLSNNFPIKVPSLHLISPQDFLFQKSTLLTTQFYNPDVIQHHFGHRIPKLGKNQKVSIRAFIKNQFQNSSQNSKL